MHLTPFDAEGAFRPIACGGELRRAAVRGAGVMILSQALGLTIQLVSFAALGRLLAPKDFGVVTMVTTFSLLLLNVGVNGFTEAVVQRPDVNHGLVSSLFWINITLGALLATGFAAAAPQLARLYHSPEVAGVAAWMSLTIVVTSASTLHLALLKRGMRFTAVSANDLFGRLVAVVVSVALALAGWGYHALVAGAIAQALSIAAGAWILCRWMPGRPRFTPSVSSAAAFAANVYGFFALNYAKSNMDNLLVGWRLGSTMLGLYKKSFDLFCVPGNQLLSPITAVAVPALSRLSGDRDRRRRYLLQTYSVLAFAGMGIGACLTLTGRDLVLLVLGPRWHEAGKIFTYFGPGIGAMFLSAPWGWLTLSIGRADRYVRWGVVELIVTGLLFVLALPWGPKGVAIAWSASLWILALPSIWYAGRPIRFGVAPVLEVIWRYVAAAFLAGLACNAILDRLAKLIAVRGLRIAMTCFAFGVLYAGVAVLMHGNWKPLHQIARLLPDLVSRSNPTVSDPAHAARSEA